MVAVPFPFTTYIIYKYFISLNHSYLTVSKYLCRSITRGLLVHGVSVAGQLSGPCPRLFSQNDSRPHALYWLLCYGHKNCLANMAITTHKIEGASCLVAVTVQFDTTEINLGSHSSLVKNYKTQEHGDKSSSVSALFILHM